jgi:hypothetical protein
VAVEGRVRHHPARRSDPIQTFCRPPHPRPYTEQQPREWAPTQPLDGRRDRAAGFFIRLPMCYAWTAASQLAPGNSNQGRGVLDLARPPGKAFVRMTWMVAAPEVVASRCAQLAMPGFDRFMPCRRRPGDGSVKEPPDDDNLVCLRRGLQPSQSAGQNLTGEPARKYGRAPPAARLRINLRLTPGMQRRLIAWSYGGGRSLMVRGNSSGMAARSLTAGWEVMPEKTDSPSRAWPGASTLPGSSSAATGPTS